MSLFGRCTINILYTTAKGTILPVGFWQAIYCQMHPELTNRWNVSYVRMPLKPFIIAFPLCQQTSHIPVLEPVPGSTPCLVYVLLFSPRALEVCSFGWASSMQAHHFTQSLASPTLLDFGKHHASSYFLWDKLLRVEEQRVGWDL